MSSPASKPVRTTAQKWKRRLAIVAIAVIAIGVIARVILAVALPKVLNTVAKHYGLDASYERSEIYLISGSVGMWHLNFTPKNKPGEPVISTEYCRADVSALNLLRGKLVVYRVEADGVEVLVDRNENGEIELLKTLLGNPTPAKTETASGSFMPKEIDFDPPLRVDSLRVNQARTHFRDRSVTPAVDTVLDLSVRLSDFGSQKRPMRFSLDMTSPPLLDAIRVEGEGTARGQSIDALMNVVVRGVHPKPAAGYLAALGIRPSGDNIAMAMKAKIKTEPLAVQTTSTTQPAGLKGTIVVSNVTASADNVEAAGVDKLTIEIDSLTPSRVVFGKILVDNVRASAARTSDGAIRVAGLDLVGAPGRAEKREAIAGGGGLLPWKVGEVNVQNVNATFTDDAVTPPAKLAVLVKQALVKNLASDGTELPTDVSVQMSLPGLAESVSVTGTALPLSAKKSLDLKIAATGVKPEAIRPYLDAIGVESRINNGALTCDVHAAVEQQTDGKLSAEAMFGNVKFSDGKELLAFEGVKVSDATIDPGANSVRIESIEVAGPQLAGARDKEGIIGAAGLILKPIASVQAPKPVKPAASPRNLAPQVATTQATAQLATAQATTAASGAVASSKPLKLEIGKLAWKNVGLSFDDEFVTPANNFSLGDTGIELTGIAVDLDPSAPASTPGKIRGWLTAPGIVGSIGVDGTIAPRGGGVAVDLVVAGKGLRADKVSAYLKSLGIEPTLKDGSIALHTAIDVAQTADGIVADVSVDGLKYADGADELAGVDGLKVTRAELSAGALSVESVAISKPRAKVSRDAEGYLSAGGARLVPATQPTGAAVASVPPAAAPSVPTTTQPASDAAKPMVITLGKLLVNDGSLAWSDQALMPAVNTVGRATVALDKLVIGKPADPAMLKLVAKVDGVIENATVSGVVSADSQTPSAVLDVAATGIREGALGAYLPPGMDVTLKDGQFRTKLEAALAPVKAGGQSAKVIATDLDFRDAGGNAALLRFDSGRIIASRIDPAGKVVAIDEVSLAGFETEARKTADGKLQLLGLTVGPAPAKEQALLVEADAPVQQASATIPPASTAAPTTSIGEILQQQRNPFPLVTLEKLDVGLKRVAVTDESRAGSAPVVLADVTVKNRKKVELLGEDPASRPPVEIEIVGRIDPVAQQFNVNTVVAPFASQPTLRVDVSASGIKGEGLVAVAPELKETIDGRPMTDGRFNLALEAHARFARKGPAEYDFGKPFDAELSVKPIEFRASPDGEVIAGLEEVRAEGVRVDPATGGAVIRTLEITKPIFHAFRDAEGIHALGCVVKLPATQPAGDEATTQPSMANEQVVTITKEADAAPAQPAVKPSAEVRIDKLLVSGLDVLLEDRTTDPKLIVPLNSLDVEVRDLSNMALYEDRPIRFSVLAGAGKVPLAGGQEKELFSQAAVNGQLSLYPAPRGWAKSSVSGFEMLALRGPASAQKVEIGGGVFDSTVDLRFRDDGMVDTKARLALTDLKMSEPPDGLIQRTLQLPAPLDAAILVLQDASGSITVPLSVTVKEGEVGTGQILGQAAGAVAQIVATAIASSPLKVAGGVGSMLGMEKEKVTGAQPAGELSFAPADAELSDADVATVNQLLEKLRRQSKLEVTLKHQLGSADVDRAGVLANPSPDDCLALASRLRIRKQQLLAQREIIASETRAQIASNGPAASLASIERLRAVDRELANTEDSLDRLYDMLRPGADRQAPRRTRSAAIDIGQARLDAVKAALVASGIPGIDQRIVVTRSTFAEPEGAGDGKVVMTVLEKKKP